MLFQCVVSSQKQHLLNTIKPAIMEPLCSSSPSVLLMPLHNYSVTHSLLYDCCHQAHQLWPLTTRIAATQTHSMASCMHSHQLPMNVDIHRRLQPEATLTSAGQLQLCLPSRPSCIHCGRHSVHHTILTLTAHCSAGPPQLLLPSPHDTYITR